MEGKDGMTKPTISLQDLRRRIYIKAKAGFGWKRWGNQFIYEELGCLMIIMSADLSLHR